VSTSRRILLVEDDEDTRQLLAIALEAQGYRVEQAGDADKGLECLHAGPYDLILSDYDLPGKTGAAMLREADAAGLLDDAATLVVTAHPDPDGVDDATLVRKPLDLEKFLQKVRGILDSRPQVHAGRGREAAMPATEGQRVGLTLYVSPASPPSVKARRNMERLLERLDGAEVDFEILDLALEPLRAETDNVVFTPTLVKHRPEPRVWILGDLSDPTVVGDLLNLFGV